jgi:hypothetical protein
MVGFEDSLMDQASDAHTCHEFTQHQQSQSLVELSTLNQVFLFALGNESHSIGLKPFCVCCYLHIQ